MLAITTIRACNLWQTLVGAALSGVATPELWTRTCLLVQARTLSGNVVPGIAIGPIKIVRTPTA